MSVPRNPQWGPVPYPLTSPNASLIYRSGRRWREVAMQRILSLHTASKVVEDLPQLIIASIFLVHRSVFTGDDAAAAATAADEASSGAVGAAIVQLVVSGVSFALTLLWLGLQINDSRYAKIRRGVSVETTLPRAPAPVTVHTLTPAPILRTVASSGVVVEVTTDSQPRSPTSEPKLALEADALESKRQQSVADSSRSQSVAEAAHETEGLRELFHDILRSSASHEIDEKVAAADAYCTEHGYHAIAEINEEEEIEEFVNALDLKKGHKKKLLERMRSAAATPRGARHGDVDKKELTTMISYTQKNPTAAKLAVSLYYKLREMGFNVWLDVQADDKSEAAMKKNVEGAKFVIAIISDGAGVEGCAYFERPFCVKELRWAKAAGKYIQPVVDASDKDNIGPFMNMAPDDLQFLRSVDFIHFDQKDAEFFQVGLQKLFRKAGDATGDPLLKAAGSRIARNRTRSRRNRGRGIGKLVGGVVGGLVEGEDER